MQAQVKYESEVKSAVLGDRTITVKNLTPVSVSYTHLTLPTNSRV